MREKVPHCQGWGGPHFELSVMPLEVGATGEVRFPLYGDCGVPSGKFSSPIVTGAQQELGENHPKIFYIEIVQKMCVQTDCSKTKELP